MIKIQLKKPQFIKEVLETDPHYYETAKLTFSNKTELEGLFQGKQRIVFETDLTIPTIIDSKTDGLEMSNDIVISSMKTLMTYTNLDENNPALSLIDKEKILRLKQDEIVLLIGDLLKRVQNSSAIPLEDKEEAKVDTISSTLKAVFQKYINLGLEIDFQKKIIKNKKPIPNPKSPTGYSSPTYNIENFINLHAAASIEMTEEARRLKNELSTNRAGSVAIYRDSKGLEAFTPTAQKVIEIIFKLKGQDPKYSVSTIRRAGFDVILLESLFYSPYGVSAYLDVSQAVRIMKLMMDKFGYERTSKKRANNSTIIITRVPIEVARMSDFPQLKSCHSVGDSWSSCATQEGISKGGAVAYMIAGTVDEKEKDRIEYTDEEIFKDSQRSQGGYNPISRLRIRTIRLHFSNYYSNTPPITLSIPSGKMYGRTFKAFEENLSSYLQQLQKPIIEQVVRMLEAGEKIKEFEVFGGGYYEGDERKDLISFIQYDENKLIHIDRFRSEYPAMSPAEPIDLPLVKREYEKELNYVIGLLVPSSLRNNLTFYITVDSDQKVGYRSGKSTPDPAPDHKFVANIKYTIDLMDLEIYLKNKISREIGIDKAFIRNVLYHYKGDNNSWRSDLKYDDDGSSPKYTYEQQLTYKKALDAVGDMEIAVKTLSTALKEMTDLSNYEDYIEQLKEGTIYERLKKRYKF